MTTKTKHLSVEIEAVEDGFTINICTCPPADEAVADFFKDGQITVERVAELP
jgi:hypothetical protein